MAKSRKRPSVSTLLDRRVTSTRAAIGAEVRATRRKLNLSQIEFAKKVGLSPGMVSKIEHGTVAASVEILVTVTQTLGVPFTQLFVGLQEAPPCFYIPSGKGLRVTREGSEHNFVHDLKGHWFSEYGLAELYLVSAQKDAKPFFCRQAGFAFLYMLSGTIHYRHGERTFVLEPGDTLYFNSTSLNGPDVIVDYPVSYLLWRQNPGSRNFKQRVRHVVALPEPTFSEQATEVSITRAVSKR